MPGATPVSDFLDRFADDISLSDGFAIPIQKALELSNSIVPIEGYRGSLLAALMSEGLLSKEMVQIGSKKSECVRFAYQRLGDHQIAKRLIFLYEDKADSRKPFAPGGEIYELFEDGNGQYQRLGMLEAMSIQVPELYGFELIDVTRVQPWRTAAPSVGGQRTGHTISLIHLDKIVADFRALVLHHAGREYRYRCSLRTAEHSGATPAKPCRKACARKRRQDPLGGYASDLLYDFASGRPGRAGDGVYQRCNFGIQRTNEIGAAGDLLGDQPFTGELLFTSGVGVTDGFGAKH